MYLVEETDTRFYLKESTVPNAGLGVFAAEPLKAGDYLEIIGVQVKTNSIADECTAFADKYKFAAAGKLVKKERTTDFSRKVVPLGYGGMVNHAPNAKMQNAMIDYHKGPKRNAAAGQPIYRFLRDIAKDEEILGNYGEQWTNIMEWAGDKANEVGDDWETFLSFDLYNLKEIMSELSPKE
ncbi:MAG: SET domain-containing protein-lysine N-methyltransferase [Candidatus Hermodarchaeia archaeon]|jgi:hypothetical protein